MFTHQKKAYRALAVQWTGSNMEEIAALVPNARLFRDSLMLRHEAGIDTLSKGDWAVRGENGTVKTYDDATFRVKYERMQ